AWFGSGVVLQPDGARLRRFVPEQNMPCAQQDWLAIMQCPRQAAESAGYAIGIYNSRPRASLPDRDCPASRRRKAGNEPSVAALAGRLLMAHGELEKTGFCTAIFAVHDP